MSSLLRQTGAGWAALAFCVTVCHAAAVPQGRWEGEVQIPGAPIRLVVDLAQDEASKWTGSVIIPGLGVKGAPLGELVITDSAISFTLSGILGEAAAAPPRIKARLVDGGTMTGEFEQAGNTATFALSRTGPAQVELAPKSTAVASELEGAWSGRFEFNGYPRQVTLKLSNHPQSGATAELVIVGKKTNRVPVDLVVQNEQFLKIESGQAGITFEGRWLAQASEIRGSIQMGPFEVPLTLRRSSSATGKRS